MHCQGKGAGGRTEGEEGTGNYKNRQEKNPNPSRDCSWDLQTLVACRHRPCLPTINIYAPATTRHLAREVSSAARIAAGAAPSPSPRRTRTTRRAGARGPASAGAGLPPRRRTTPAMHVRFSALPRQCETAGFKRARGARADKNKAELKAGGEKKNKGEGVLKKNNNPSGAPNPQTACPR